MSLWRYGWWLDEHPGVALTASSGGQVLPAGTYYWEVTEDVGGLGSDAGWGILIGIANSSFNLTDSIDAINGAPYPGSQYGMMAAARAFGATAVGGYPARTFSAFAPITATGQSLGVALNTTTHRLWWRRNTGGDVRWNADGSANPATGVGGYDTSATGDSPVLGNVYAIVGADLGNNGGFGSPYNQKGKGTVNFGASAFIGTPPSGFISPESLNAGSTLNPNDNSRLLLSNGNLTFEMTGTARDPGIGDPFCCIRSRFSIAQA